MDKIDYKRTEKHLYLPKVPAIVDVPEMVFFAVDGKGDPRCVRSSCLSFL